jgi:alpha-ribazole phosphatase
MTTRVFLVRHGETQDADPRRYKGHIDVPLSERGIERMRHVAERIRSNSPLTAVYCSDLSRALRSAEIVAEPHSLSPVVEPALRERSFGIWEGMSFDEIRDQYPAEFDAWARNPLQHSPMEGESTAAVRKRCLRAYRQVTQRHAGKTIAVVAHGSVNRIILCHTLGVPLSNMFRIEQDFGALNVIEIHTSYPRVRLLNG